MFCLDMEHSQYTVGEMLAFNHQIRTWFDKFGEMHYSKNKGGVTKED